MKPMKTSADNTSKGAPHKADHSQITGNISIFLKADVRNILSLGVRQRQVSNTH